MDWVAGLFGQAREGSVFLMSRGNESRYFRGGSASPEDDGRKAIAEGANI